MRQRTGLLLVLLGHVCLALLYAWTIPAWEAPDEPAHLRRVQSLACALGWDNDEAAVCAGQEVLGRQAVWHLQPSVPGEPPPPCSTGSVGDDTTARTTVWDRDSLLQSYEEYQPRLGHLLWVPWFLRTGPGRPPIFVNPDYPGEGPGVFLHDLDDDPAVAPSVRQLRVLRSFGALLGLLTVWGVWRCGRLLAPKKPGVALAAAAAVAFLPQFTFVAGYVNNDLPAAAAGAWLTALVLQRLRPGKTVTVGWAAGITLLLFVAAATRPNAAGLVVLVILALLALQKKHHGWKNVLALSLGMTLAGLASLWAVRTVLPSFWLTWSGHFEARLLGGTALTPLDGFLGISRSLVGVFGWMDVPLPPWVYATTGLLALLLLGSLIAQLCRSSDTWFRTVVGVLAAGFLGVGVPTFLNALSRGQTQGRYLFPALGILAVLSGLAACGSYDARTGWRLASVIALLLLAGNVAALRGVLAPTYSTGGQVHLTRLDTPTGPLLIQHASADGAPGLAPDAEGRWILAASAGQRTSARLSLRLFQHREQALLRDASVAGRKEHPADLPGVSAVTSSGPGDSTADRVQPLVMTVGQIPRHALLEHPTSRIVLDPVRIPSGAHVRVTLGIDDRVRDKPGDGVTFRLLLLPGHGEEVLLMERHLDPRSRPGDGAWWTETVALDALAGTQGSFVLETSPGPLGDARHDWSAWAGLDLVVPMQPIPTSLCDASDGRQLNLDDVALDLPAGGNITLQLTGPLAAGSRLHLSIVPPPVAPH